MSFNFKDAQLTYWNQDLQLTSRLTGVFQTEIGGSAFGTVGATSSSAVAFTLRGLRIPVGTGAAGTAAGAANQISPGDSVIVTPTATLAGGLSVYGYISAANTLTVVLANAGAGTPAGGTPNFIVTIFKFGQLDGLSA
jgi:hypothetical protein